jgi:cholesterol oxidase
MTVDVAIIGSGFGGAVTACRLAQAGRSVVLLERGRRWMPEDYPRGPDDAWIFDIDEPHRQNGWLDLRILDDMWVAQGAGVGGGSLIYANVSIDATEAAFREGWPAAITLDAMRPYYERAADALKPMVIPDRQETPRTRLMREAADATGAGARFRKVPLAVSFDPEGVYPGDRPPDEMARKRFRNAFGREQGFCVHCGNCDIGCKAQAKNTLDLNYLAMAEESGARIVPLAMASHVSTAEDGCRVHYDAIGDGRREPKVLAARQVVLAAGSLGSTELLLRSQAAGGLTGLSPALGRGWSSNGDFLTPAFYPGRRISPTIGPTITAAIDYLDGSDGGARYFVEDGGFPDVLGNALSARKSRAPWFGGGRQFLATALSGFSDGDPLETVMPWFGQAMDGGDGRLYLGRDWLRPWRRRLKLDWDIKRSELGVGGLVRAHERLSAATGGHAVVPPTWTILRNLVTPHPLGGCRMADRPADGVVDDRGRVHGHNGIYVADGAIVPRPLGLNPSKTIAALAERVAEGMLA